MRAQIFKVATMAVFAFITGLNVYKAQTEIQLSDAQMKNVEALASGEGGTCIEWVDKSCYDENNFTHTLSKDFHAICAGTPSVPGGKLECGNFSIYEPNAFWQGSLCLYCVKRQ